MGYRIESFDISNIEVLIYRIERVSQILIYQISKVSISCFVYRYRIELDCRTISTLHHSFAKLLTYRLLIILYQCVFLGTFARFYPPPVDFFLALSAAGPAGGPPMHHVASLGPGWAPWRVLWAFQVAKSCKQSRGCFRRS